MSDIEATNPPVPEDEPREPLKVRWLLEGFDTEDTESEEEPTKLPQWWLSFVDPEKSAPRDEQVAGGPGFLGVCIVRAKSDLAAVALSKALLINPGGEVAMLGPLPEGLYGPELENRLIPREEAFTL